MPIIISMLSLPEFIAVMQVSRHWRQLTKNAIDLILERFGATPEILASLPPPRYFYDGFTVTKRHILNIFACTCYHGGQMRPTLGTDNDATLIRQMLPNAPQRCRWCINHKHCDTCGTFRRSSDDFDCFIPELLMDDDRRMPAGFSPVEENMIEVPILTCPECRWQCNRCTTPLVPRHAQAAYVNFDGTPDGTTDTKRTPDNFIVVYCGTCADACNTTNTGDRVRWSPWVDPWNEDSDEDSDEDPPHME
jgi:hypothetical protein